MKNIKKTIIIFCLIMTTNLLNAQVYLGLNSKSLFFPDAIGNGDVLLGKGIDLLVGYSLHKRLNFDIKFSGLFFEKQTDKYYFISSIKSVEVNAKLYGLQKSIKPYIGFGLGYYDISSYIDYYYTGFFPFLSNPFISKQDTFSFGSEIETIGIIHSLGLLFNLSSSNNFFLNTEFSAHIIFNPNDYSDYSLLGNINIGLMYYFKE